MLRRVLVATIVLVFLSPAASAASLSISFADPAGDAKPNLPAIDIVAVTGTLDDVRMTAELKLQGAVEPTGTEYLCIAEINPTLPAHPRYELSFGDNRFAAKVRYGDSSAYTISTEGAAWSERGIHFVAKRGETSVVDMWDLTCTTKHTNADGTKTGDYADKNSIPAPAVAKAKGAAASIAPLIAILAVGGVALLRRRV